MNIEKYTEELITLRHYFHQYPELALQEVETSAYIPDLLMHMVDLSAPVWAMHPSPP